MTTAPSTTDVRPDREPIAKPADPILARAVGVLARHGWCQVALRSSRSGGVCALGAIASVRVAGSGGDVTPVYEGLFGKRLASLEALACSLGWKPTRRAESLPMLRCREAIEFVSTWNDAKGRTADEVAEALERAAYGL